MPTILVVDDEPSIRRLLRVTLEDAGFRTLEASDGVTALSLARQELPDAAVVDVALPRLSGLDLCRRLGEDPARRTHVLLLSGLLPPLDAQHLSLVGPAGWIAKPFDPRELLGRVQSILGVPTALP